MAESKAKTTATAPKGPTAAEKRIAASIEELQAQVDRLNRTVGELVAGNQFNAREAWS
jgi:hypothetical protein